MVTFINSNHDNHDDDDTVAGDRIINDYEPRSNSECHSSHNNHTRSRLKQRRQQRPLLRLGGLFITISVTVVVCWLVSAVSGQLYEGSACRTQNGTYGLCKVHRHCVWAMEGYKVRAFTYMDVVRCGFKGRDELICCLDEMPDQSTTEATDDFIFQDNDVVVTSSRPITPVTVPSPPPRSNTRRRSQTECTRFVQEYSALTFHILGGEQTNLGEFPHMAALGYPTDDDNQPTSWRCGGSLVAENYILTAAHCLTRAQPTVVRLGQVDLSANAENSEAQDFQIAEVIMHPDYVPNRNYHDIALLRLAANVQMTENVYPACLRTNVADVPNESLIVTGWGDTSVERRERSNVLLKTNITVVDLAVCNQTYAEGPSDRRLPSLLGSGMLCATDPTQTNDACQGDSGGPLQIRQPNNFGLVVGVTSFGRSCGSTTPSVYTRVAFYIDWLESVLWPN